MSLRADSEKAGREVLEEAMAELAEPGAGVAILFATSHHAGYFPELLQSIRKKTRARSLLAATGAGIVGPRGEVEQSPGMALLLFSSERVTSGAALIPHLDTPDAVEHLRGEAPSLYRERGTLLAVVDPRSMHTDFFSKLARVFPETPVVGAAAGWCTPDQTVTLAADGEISAHGGACLHLAGSLEPAVGIAQAVMPEDEPALITKAIGNIIQEIDSQPAADVLGQFVQTIREQSPKGEAPDVYCTLADTPRDLNSGRYLVRNILAVEPDNKQMTIAESVQAGQYISFGCRSARGARRSFRQMIERLNASMSSKVPRGAVIFNCCARGQTLYGRPHVDLDAFHEFFPELPIVGLFGFAEIGPIFWEGRKMHSSILNHTAVLTIFSEPMEALGAA